MAIGLSERAVTELRRIITEQDLPEGTALRVGVKGGGCSGFSYTLGFDDKISEVDQITETEEGLRIVCDPKSFLYLNGTELDFDGGSARVVALPFVAAGGAEPA